MKHITNTDLERYKKILKQNPQFVTTRVEGRNDPRHALYQPAGAHYESCSGVGPKAGWHPEGHRDADRTASVGFGYPEHLIAEVADALGIDYEIQLDI